MGYYGSIGITNLPVTWKSVILAESDKIVSNYFKTLATAQPNFREKRDMRQRLWANVVSNFKEKQSFPIKKYTIDGTYTNGKFFIKLGRRPRNDGILNTIKSSSTPFIRGCVVMEENRVEKIYNFEWPMTQKNYRLRIVGEHLWFVNWEQASSN
jgi:hypothetical protein